MTRAAYLLPARLTACPDETSAAPAHHEGTPYMNQITLLSLTAPEATR
jgi:hypothetical protein